jgi:hypothetical protein
MGAAIHNVAALTLLSGIFVAYRMYETLPDKQRISEQRKTDEISNGK